jgi:serralysin
MLMPRFFGSRKSVSQSRRRFRLALDQMEERVVMSTLPPTFYQMPTVSVANTTVQDGQTATFNVSLNHAYCAPVTICYDSGISGGPVSLISGGPGTYGTATPGVDYTASHGGVTIPAGATTATISVQTLLDKNLDAGSSKTFGLYYEGYVGVNAQPVGGGMALATVNGVTLPNAPTISTVGSTVQDGQTDTFNVYLSHTYSTPITVNYSTTSISAVAGVDYTAKSGTLTFPAGVQTESISIPTLVDNGFPTGSSRTFAVQLSGGTAGGGSIVPVSTPQAVVTINGTAAALPTISIQNAPAINSGQTATFTVSLSHTYNYPIAVSVSTVNNYWAIQGQDYKAISLLVGIPAGSLSTTVSVPTLSDSSIYQGNYRVLEVHLDYAYPASIYAPAKDLAVTNATATAVIEGVTKYNPSPFTMYSCNSTEFVFYPQPYGGYLVEMFHLNSNGSASYLSEYYI